MNVGVMKDYKLRDLRASLLSYNIVFRANFFFRLRERTQKMGFLHMIPMIKILGGG